MFLSLIKSCVNRKTLFVLIFRWTSSLKKLLAENEIMEFLLRKLCHRSRMTRKIVVDDFSIFLGSISINNKVQNIVIKKDVSALDDFLFLWVLIRLEYRAMFYSDRVVPTLQQNERKAAASVHWPLHGPSIFRYCRKTFGRWRTTDQE